MRAIINLVRHHDGDHVRLDERSTLPQPWNPKQIDPALMTYGEYYKLSNEDNKWHSSEAYEISLARLNNQGWAAKSKFPHFLKRVKIKGLEFEFRLQVSKNSYSHKDENGLPIVGSNMSDDEIAAKGLQPHDFSIAIYDEDGACCGLAVDEWGCVLVQVANEYRGFGLGPILGRIARTFEPGKTSGGFTSHGAKNFAKLHREMVRDALTSGRYMDEIRSGRLTIQRVREIVGSAKLQMRPKRPEGDLGSKDPKDWLLYAEDGCFVLYDRKLREIVEQGGDDVWRWAERMIKAYLLVRIPNEYGIVVRFGGDADGLKRYLLTLGAAWCEDEGVTFAVDEEDVGLIDQRRLSVGPVHYDSGMRRCDVALDGPIPDPRGVIAAEVAFRKSFDRHGEFKQWVLELADAKFRPEPK